ncbi:MAG: hypothetical protein LBL63_00155 [Clostridiales Family XIII bacterium]|nr:hypothetical protein [Clostridiales Family XIII bacterium]
MNYRQAIGYAGGYASDVRAYLPEEYGSSVFRIIPLVFQWLYEPGGTVLGIAFFMSAVTCGVIVVVRIFVGFLLRREGIEEKSRMVPVMSAASIFAMSVYLPKIHEYFYIGAWSGFPWHNPPYQLMVCFSLLSLLFFFKLYDRYPVESSRNMWPAFVAFALAVFVSVGAKPSFVFGFFPLMAILLLRRMIKKHESVPFSRRFARAVPFGVALLPSVAYLIYFYFADAAETASGGIAINFAYLYKMAGDPVLKPILGLAFPLWILCFHVKKLRTNIIYVMAWLMFAVNLAIYLLFVEAGERFLHGNFGWGLLFSVFFLFVAGISLYAEDWISVKKIGANTQKKICLGVGGLLFAAHLISGLVFFSYAVGGKGY